MIVASTSLLGTTVDAVSITQQHYVNVANSILPIKLSAISADDGSSNPVSVDGRILVINSEQRSMTINHSSTTLRI